MQLINIGDSFEKALKHKHNFTRLSSPSDLHYLPPDAPGVPLTYVTQRFDDVGKHFFEMYRKPEGNGGCEMKLWQRASNGINKELDTFRFYLRKYGDTSMKFYIASKLRYHENY